MSKQWENHSGTVSMIIVWMSTDWVHGDIVEDTIDPVSRIHTIIIDTGSEWILSNCLTHCSTFICLCSNSISPRWDICQAKNRAYVCCRNGWGCFPFDLLRPPFILCKRHLTQNYSWVLGNLFIYLAFTPLHTWLCLHAGSSTGFKHIKSTSRLLYNVFLTEASILIAITSMNQYSNSQNSTTHARSIFTKIWLWKAYICLWRAAYSYGTGSFFYTLLIIFSFGAWRTYLSKDNVVCPSSIH